MAATPTVTGTDATAGPSIRRPSLSHYTLLVHLLDVLLLIILPLIAGFTII